MAGDDNVPVTANPGSANASQNQLGALQGSIQSNSPDNGLLTQLADNPFFTAVGLSLTLEEGVD